MVAAKVDDAVAGADGNAVRVDVDASAGADGNAARADDAVADGNAASIDTDADDAAGQARCSKRLAVRQRIISAYAPRRRR